MLNPIFLKNVWKQKYPGRWAMQNQITQFQ